MGHNFAAKFKTGALAKQFALAGRARLTLKSEETGTRFTFRITRKDEKSPHFVGVLTGADNTHSYTYLGTIFEGGKVFRHGKKSPISSDALSAKAFAWAWGYLSRGELPPKCEVWHESRCGRCGRPLTVPASIETGLGPVCEEKEAI